MATHEPRPADGSTAPTPAEPAPAGTAPEGPGPAQRTPPTPPTQQEAQDALADLDADSVNLAALVVTPWWYHLGLAVIVAIIIGAQGLPGAGSIIGTAVGILGLPLLSIAYTRRYGVALTRPTGPRSRALLLASVGALVAGMIAVVVLKVAEQPGYWAAVPALLVAIATVILGRCYDDALRRELAAGSRGPA